MPTLKIDLQEGFDGDHVIVEVDGRVVLDKDGVRTRMQVGLAESLQVETGAQAQVLARLPEKGCERTETVPVQEKPNLGIFVNDEGVHFKYPPEGQVMFGYV
jgi:hypothetical protein